MIFSPNEKEARDVKASLFFIVLCYQAAIFLNSQITRQAPPTDAMMFTMP